MENSMEGPLKTKNRVTIWSRNPTGIYLDKILIGKNTCTPKLTPAFFKTANTWEQLKCPPTEEWIKKMCYIYNGILLSQKTEWNMPFAATWMDLEITILSGVSQTERQISWYHIHMNLKKWYKWTYLHNRNRLTEIENKFRVTKGERVGSDKLGVWD